MAAEGLVVEDLMVHRGGRLVLHGVSLRLLRGEVGVVLGPNGAGKTTLLHSIAGVVKPAQGRIVVAGTVVYDSARGLSLSPERRGVALVPQSLALFPHMTVEGNIRFALRPRRLPRSEEDERLRRVAEMLEITHLLPRRPSQLSGGERQRVALARALAAEPRLLLLDEPFSALDAPTRERLRRLLRRVLHEADTTALMVTHSFSDAWLLGTRLYLLRGGKLHGGAPPREIAEKPLSHGVAEFLGLQVLEARVDDRDSSILHVAGLGLLRVARRLRPGARILVSLRADDIVPTNREGPNTYRARVLESLLTRYSVRLLVETQGGLTLLVEAPRGLLLAQGGIPGPGDTVLIHIPPEAPDVAEAPG